jgi:hypothetical protein
VGREGGSTAALVVAVDAGGRISVDVGARFVEVDPEDLERVLDRLRDDGGSMEVLQPAGSDDGDEPFDRGADTGAEAVAFVVGMAQARGIAVRIEEDRGW